MPTGARTYDQRRKRKYERRPNDDKHRPTSNQRGYTYQWSKASKAWLQSNPLCVHCNRRGEIKAAACVDHIVPHRGDKDLFWDSNNWQGLCWSCHSSKTACGG